jgi:acyl-coenzyme A thioesterase PaaI-like protein
MTYLPQTRAALPDDHFLHAMGINVACADGEATGTAALLPSMWPTWSNRPRLAILATFVDVVAGHVPDGPRNPTVDLRVQVTDSVPDTGLVELVSRPLRVGRRLVVARTTLCHGGRPFASAVTTFMNRVVGTTPFTSGALPSDLESYERLVDAQVIDACTLEVEPIPQLSNGMAGTVQGGVQAFVAELAAEHVCGPDFEAVDLDIRYLARMDVGPLRAEAEPVGRTGNLETVHVRLHDAGNADRTVSSVVVLLQRRDP